MAAPQQLQVLYGQTRARITWRPPPPISALGNLFLDTVIELNLIIPHYYPYRQPYLTEDSDP